MSPKKQRYRAVMRELLSQARNFTDILLLSLKELKTEALPGFICTLFYVI